MSFYIGKYGGVTSQCHITSGNHDISLMRGSTFSGTVFHSDTCYPTHTAYVMNPAGCDIRMHHLEGDVFGCEYTGDTGWYDKINDGYAYIICVGSISSGSSLYPTTRRFAWTNDLWWNDNGYYQMSTIYYTPHNKLIIEGASMGTITVIVFNFKYTGSITCPNTNTNDEIFLKGSSNNTGVFNVNGTNLATLQYLNRRKINTTDSIILVGGSTLQLINSIGAGAGVTIKSNNSTGTQVAIGGKNIIDTTKGAGGYFISSNGYNSIGSAWVDQYNRPLIRTISGALSAGEIKFVTIAYGGLRRTVHAATGFSTDWVNLYTFPIQLWDGDRNEYYNITGAISYKCLTDGSVQIAMEVYWLRYDNDGYNFSSVYTNSITIK